MRLKRTRKNFGGGSGRCTHEGVKFRVVVWELTKGTQTVIESRLFGSSMELRFDGEHIFKSDIECAGQLTGGEIIRLIDVERKAAYESGRDSKLKQIKTALGL